MRSLLKSSLLLLLGCASKPVIYEPGPLTHEILVLRGGHKTLTNGHCAAFTGDACSDFEVKDFDLSDPILRDQMRQSNFVCKVGQSQRYLICKDQPGLCAEVYTCTLNLFWNCLAYSHVTNVIPQSAFPKYLPAGITCFNEDQFSYESM